ncbi:MAG: hypothetical protein R3E68_16775 [Burkholderiaceae bacterium]
MPTLRLPVLSALPIAALVLHRLPALLPAWSVWVLGAGVPIAWWLARRWPVMGWGTAFLLSFVLLHHQAEQALRQRLAPGLEACRCWYRVTW